MVNKISLASTKDVIDLILQLNDESITSHIETIIHFASKLVITSDGDTIFVDDLLAMDNSETLRFPTTTGGTLNVSEAKRQHSNLVFNKPVAEVLYDILYPLNHENYPLHFSQRFTEESGVYQNNLLEQLIWLRYKHYDENDYEDTCLLKDIEMQKKQFEERLNSKKKLSLAFDSELQNINQEIRKFPDLASLTTPQLKKLNADNNEQIAKWKNRSDIINGFIVVAGIFGSLATYATIMILAPFTLGLSTLLGAAAACAFIPVIMWSGHLPNLFEKKTRPLEESNAQIKSIHTLREQRIEIQKKKNGVDTQIKSIEDKLEILKTLEHKLTGKKSADNNPLSQNALVLLPPPPTTQNNAATTDALAPRSGPS